MAQREFDPVLSETAQPLSPRCLPPSTAGHLLPGTSQHSQLTPSEAEQTSQYQLTEVEG